MLRTRLTTIRNVLIVSSIVALASGCPLFFDVDTVSFDEGAADMTVTPDAAEPPDTAEPVDDSIPAEDVGVDMPVDMPTGDPDLPPPPGTCTDQPGDIGGDCGLVAQDCPGEDVCELQVANDEFIGVCTARGTTTYDLALGEACETNSVAEKCQPGLVCRIGVCTAYCRLADGTGCMTGEFCTRLAPQIDEFGVCAASCG